MIMNCTVNSSIEISSLLDLPKLKFLVKELNLKIKKSYDIFEQKNKKD